MYILALCGQRELYTQTFFSKVFEEILNHNVRAQHESMCLSIAAHFNSNHSIHYNMRTFFYFCDFDSVYNNSGS